MILAILFVVFFALWAVATLYPQPPYERAGGVLALLCVGILGWCAFHGAL